ncbi:beta-crystallin S-1-like [Oryzias latipes]|uniref:beta-crystallin S-1-like n=1 Tax=Oryzias latipes TaxID=8090 RepID=UPI000CE27919|nr:beta-crystallin S-1-like [Oryzias latipes]
MAKCSPLQVVFYEDRIFGGRSHEREDDASELHAYIRRCNSIRVEGGFWVLYQRPNYRGFQYVLGPGEYPDHQYWLGFSDAVRSCRLIRHVGASWRMKVWEEPNFEGESLELGENVPTFQEHWQNRPVHSCKVLEGAWVFYDQPNYRGRQYLLERGQYRRHSEWGGMQPSVGSIRRVESP